VGIEIRFIANQVVPKTPLLNGALAAPPTRIVAPLRVGQVNDPYGMIIKLI